MSCIAIIGAGQMGLHMAATFAHHGYTVRMFDVYRDVLDSVHQRQSELLQELLEDGVLMEPYSPGMILCMSLLEEAVASAEFIFECVSEDASVKHEIMEKISRFARPNAVIASSTMRIPLELFMKAVSNPQRAIGVRFLMPVFYVNLVEITTMNDPTVGATSLDTINRVRTFLSTMRMTAYLRQNLEPHVLNEAAREQFKLTFIQRQHEQLAAARTVNQSLLEQSAPNMMLADSVPLQASRGIPASEMSSSGGFYLSPRHVSGEGGSSEASRNMYDSVGSAAPVSNSSQPRGTATSNIRGGISTQSLHNLSSFSSTGLSPSNSGVPLTAMLLQRRLSHSGGLLNMEGFMTAVGAGPGGGGGGGGERSGLGLGVSMAHCSTLSSQDCVFCYERPRNTLLRPCCHLILCAPCAHRLHARGDSCPICRSDIHEVINVFAA